MRLLITLIFLSFIGANAIAQGDLLVYPKRVMFDGAKRAETLNLSNVGEDTATYTISFVQYRMNENGSFQQISTPDSGQYFSDNNIRFFPRTVTLAPKESQTVKLQLVKSNMLAPGEYRSHIYFRAMAKQNALGEKDVVKDSGISIKIVPIFGISIPAIIRVGDNDASVSLNNSALSLENDTLTVLNTVFNRNGNMSVYGDISVDYISPENVITKVGTAKGMAVYTPTLKRSFKLRLQNNAAVDYSKGKLVISYSDQSPKPIVLAKDEIVLSPDSLKHDKKEVLPLTKNN